MPVNQEAIRVIRQVGSTPGFRMEATDGGVYRLIRSAIPDHGVTLESTQVSSHHFNRQFKNDMTRLKRIGWTEELYALCEEISRRHRMRNSNPEAAAKAAAEEHLPVLLAAFGVSPDDGPEGDGSLDSRPAPKRRHGKGGTATGSAKVKAGEAIEAEPALPVQEAPKEAEVVVLEDAVKIRLELITPDRALDLIVKMAPYQRKVRDSKVTDYAAAIKRGEWIPNPADPVCIDTNGQTANGQHRLQAIVECEVAAPLYIAYDVDPKAYQAMDRGAQRTTADMLYGAGEVSTTRLSSAAKLAHLWFHVDQDQWKSTPAVTEAQVFAILEAHPNLRESVRLGHIGGSMKVSPTASILAHYLIARKMDHDTHLVTRWYQAIGKVALAEGQPGHSLALHFLKNAPGARRRTALTGPRTNRQWLDMYLIIQAWNNTAIGKEQRGVSWKPDFTISPPVAPTSRHNFPPLD